MGRIWSKPDIGQTSVTLYRSCPELGAQLGRTRPTSTGLGQSSAKLDTDSAQFGRRSTELARCRQNSACMQRVCMVIVLERYLIKAAYIVAAVTTCPPAIQLNGCTFQHHLRNATFRTETCASHVCAAHGTRSRERRQRRRLRAHSPSGPGDDGAPCPINREGAQAPGLLVGAAQTVEPGSVVYRPIRAREAMPQHRMKAPASNQVRKASMGTFCT